MRLCPRQQIPWYDMIWYGMVEVCEGASVAVGNVVLLDHIRSVQFSY